MVLEQLLRLLPKEQNEASENRFPTRLNAVVLQTHEMRMYRHQNQSTDIRTQKCRHHKYMIQITTTLLQVLALSNTSSVPPSFFPTAPPLLLKRRSSFGVYRSKFLKNVDCRGLRVILRNSSSIWRWRKTNQLETGRGKQGRHRNL